MLIHTPKRVCSILVYLQDIKKSVDSLVVAGSLITIEEHIEFILDDLSEEYDVFITFVTSRTNHYSVEVEALLLAQEDRLEKYRNNNDLIYQAHIASFPCTKSFPTNQRNIQGSSRSMYNKQSFRFTGARSSTKPSWTSSSYSSSSTTSTKIQNLLEKWPLCFRLLA